MSRRQSPSRGTTARADQGNAQLRGAGAYPQELVPAVRPGDHAELVPLGEIKQVDAMVPQPGVLALDSDGSNGVTVADGSTDSDNELTNLEMPEGWLAQYRITQPADDMDDGVTFTVDMGGSQAPMYTNKTFRGEIIDSTATQHAETSGGSDVTADTLNTHLLEFYIWEDEVPYLTIENSSGAQVTADDILFQGFQYRMADVSGSPNGNAEPLPVERVRE